MRAADPCPTNNAKRAKHSKILKPGCFFVFTPFYQWTNSVLCVSPKSRSISTTNMPTLVDAAKEVDALVYEAVVNASVDGGMDRGGKGESSEHQDTIDHILRGLNIDSEVAQHNGSRTHTFIEGLQVDPCQRSSDGHGGAGAGEGEGVGGEGRSLIF